MNKIYFMTHSKLKWDVKFIIIKYLGHLRERRRHSENLNNSVFFLLNLHIKSFNSKFYCVNE